MSTRAIDLRVYLQAIETELVRALAPDNLPLRDSPYFDAMLNMLRYHLGWTDTKGNPVRADAGKRLRPLIVVLSCIAVGGEWSQALPAAAAVELVHNFSLIHDDIEDNSPDRRGRPAVWKVWGLAHGTNVGDGMFALARLSLDRLPLDAETCGQLHETFDRATLALTQGQYLDLVFETRERVTVAEYVEMVRGKTAALLAACAEIGARIGTADPRIVKAFADYGENLGIAFQIIDDVLGIWGDPAVTGKPAGDDLWARKKSYPVLAAAAVDSSGQVDAFLRQERVTQEDFAAMLAVLDHVGARTLAETEAERYLKRALAALDLAGMAGPAEDELRRLTFSAVQRNK